MLENQCREMNVLVKIIQLVNNGTDVVSNPIHTQLYYVYYAIDSYIKPNFPIYFSYVLSHSCNRYCSSEGCLCFVNAQLLVIMENTASKFLIQITYLVSHKILFIFHKSFKIECVTYCTPKSFTNNVKVYSQLPFFFFYPHMTIASLP